MLMPGEALIASPFTPFAVPVKIHLYEEYLAKEIAKNPPRAAPKTSPDRGFY
jgi:hypothetical protein